MQNRLLKEFRKNWEVERYAAPGGRVLLAVSGGVDSMVMASLFLQVELPFGVAHCNFGLRGAASDRDEQMVKEWCAVNNVPFHCVQFETKQRAEEWKKGIQETARILRYEWFEQVRKDEGYLRIATAHHANDNVETLLINLFKGTGISGLHGILPVNGSIIRPLLFATREDIAAYAAANDVPYRNDASNDTDDYLRNAVRHNIIPAAQQWFPGMVERVNESISRFGQAELLYRKSIEQERKKLIEQRGNDYYIPILKLRHRHPLETICYELLYPFGFSSAQLPHVLHLLETTTGHYVSSPTHRVIRNRDFLVVTTIPAETADMIIIDATPCTIDTGKHHFSFSVQAPPKTFTADPDIAYLDMKSIEFPLVLRKWKQGDYLYPFGMKMKKKKVARLLIDEKVPLHEKEDVRVLECGKRIAWVSGIRPDERFRVKESTEQVLVVRRTAK